MSAGDFMYFTLGFIFYSMIKKVYQNSDEERQSRPMLF